jgi:hypothetical protein
LTRREEETRKKQMRRHASWLLFSCMGLLWACDDSGHDPDGGLDADVDAFDGGDGDLGDGDLPACPDGMVFIEVEGLNPFCIDTYEHPGVDGMLPTIGLPWFQARDVCVDERKQLCTEDQWIAACSGTPSEACRGDLAAAGSRPECISDHGVFDMAGNAEEWTSTPGGAVTFYVRGGSSLDDGIGCDLREELPAEDRSTVLGLRCCRQAWRR